MCFFMCLLRLFALKYEYLHWLHLYGKMASGLWAVCSCITLTSRAGSWQRRGASAASHNVIINAHNHAAAVADAPNQAHDEKDDFW